jgi:hypothetical protein
MGKPTRQLELLPGTLDLLILKRSPAAGYTDTAPHNRRARYYDLTPAGRKQLAAERADFERMVIAIQRVLQTA